MTKRKPNIEDGNSYFKASGADHGTKAKVIHHNAHKYSIVKMCKVLEISRSVYYYHMNRLEQEQNDEEDKAVINAFKESRSNYGARKIRQELWKQGIIMSRRRIRKIMMKHGLVSTYQVKRYKNHTTKSNQALIKNELDRDFNNKERHQVIVSDLNLCESRKHMALHLCFA